MCLVDPVLWKNLTGVFSYRRSQDLCDSFKGGNACINIPAFCLCSSSHSSSCFLLYCNHSSPPSISRPPLLQLETLRQLNYLRATFKTKACFIPCDTSFVFVVVFADPLLLGAATRRCSALSSMFITPGWETFPIRSRVSRDKTFNICVIDLVE